MPIYEYRCQNCGHEMEAWQKMNEAPLVQCPTCNKDGLRKLISSTSFQLKGTGWYVTDFKNKDTQKPKEASSETPSSSDKTDDSGSSSSSHSENK